MRNHAGILTGRPRWDDHEMTVLLITPGIPFEWVARCCKVSAIERSQLKRLIRAANEADFAEAALNAASIDAEDGWLMLKAIPAKYKGAVPLYSQLWLQGTELTDRKVAAKLGVRPGRIAKWRTKCVFDPLTGARIISPIGASL